MHLIRAYGPAPEFAALLAVNLALEHADVGQIAVLLGVVETIAHDEGVLDLEAHIVGLYVGLAPGGLIERA